jgi:hypothetical protein
MRRSSRQRTLVARRSTRKSNASEAIHNIKAAHQAGAALNLGDRLGFSASPRMLNSVIRQHTVRVIFGYADTCMKENFRIPFESR